MEPFEWLVLGVGLVAGGLFGVNSKGIMRSAAKGYLTIEEKTRAWSANVREDLRDAVEEARYERDQAEYEVALEEEHGRAGSDALSEAHGSGRRGRGSATAARGRGRAKNSTPGRTRGRNRSAARSADDEQRGDESNP